jgi:pyroglutamyl-peptidase
VAFFSTLPIKTSLLALQDAGIPAHISQTAGTYVCNQVFYALMHALRRRRDTRAGFVHVPWSPEQAARHGQPGMPIDQVTRALEIVVRTAQVAAGEVRVAARNPEGAPRHCLSLSSGASTALIRVSLPLCIT